MHFERLHIKIIPMSIHILLFLLTKIIPMSIHILLFLLTKIIPMSIHIVNQNYSNVYPHR